MIARTPVRRAAAELRKAGIPAHVHKRDESILVLPTLGGEAVAALRMLHPPIQKLTIQTGLTPKLPKKK